MSQLKSSHLKSLAETAIWPSWQNLYKILKWCWFWWASSTLSISPYRSSRSELFLGKPVLKICSKFTGEHPCQRVISIKLQIALRHGCSPVNLLHIFRTAFPKNTSGWLLLTVAFSKSLFFYSHKKCHSLPGISDNMHITAKFQKTEFDKYATSGVSAFIITSICLI